MKTLLLLLFVALVGCEKSEEVKPEIKLPQVERLSKVYRVEFLVHSDHGGNIDIKAPSILVLDNYTSNDTTGGQRFYLDFEYSFESDLVNKVWMDCSNLIPREPKDYYVASISVDGVVVACDSTIGSGNYGWGCHLEYVIEK